ncbi:Atypical Arm repeat [Sesbania bispinosa]|nr:Atypical Arm repeat [Sesbania bispinosa]
MLEGVWSDDHIVRMAATAKFREFLAWQLSLGFVQFLKRNFPPRLKVEATWCLSNIACGNSELIIKHGNAVPRLVRLLRSRSADIRENVKPALPVLRLLINYLSDEEVVKVACWTLSYITADADTNEKLQVVIQTGVCPRLIQLLHSDPSAPVIEPALRTLGSVVSGDDDQTQFIIDSQVLPCLHQFLTQNYKERIKAIACWTISNITGGRLSQVQAVIEANIIPPLLDLVRNPEFNIKKEAVWAISNAIYRGSIDQIKFLVNHGCIEALSDILTCLDPEILLLCMEGLQLILMVGEICKQLGQNDGVNVFIKIVDDCEGFIKIKSLQTHDNKAIKEMAVAILTKFWAENDV